MSRRVLTRLRRANHPRQMRPEPYDATWLDRRETLRPNILRVQSTLASKLTTQEHGEISKWEHGHAAPSALQLLHLGVALGERPETFLEGLVQLTWEKIALDLPDDAKAIVYDLAKYLKERGPVPRPANEVNRGA